MPSEDSNNEEQQAKSQNFPSSTFFVWSLDRKVSYFIIWSFLLVCLAYDIYYLVFTYLENGLRIGVGRGICAILLGWILGWYLVDKCSPTRNALLHICQKAPGHIVATISIVFAFAFLALVHWVGSRNLVFVVLITFLPVASYFSAKQDPSTSVHLITGIGIGALLYIVWVGIP
jgi:hypothetical protein